MTWTINQLEKTSEIEYIPGSPRIPAVEGTPGSPAYTYWEVTYTAPAYTFYSPLAPTDWTNPAVNQYGQVIGGSGGWRIFDGVVCSQIGFSAESGYLYSAPGGDPVYTAVDVPAVAPVAAVPGQPAVESEFVTDYKLGWNAGALAMSSLPVNQVVQWRFNAGSVGTIVGITRTWEPQDSGYFGMELGIMASSGQWSLYKDGTSITSPIPFNQGDTFALLREGGGAYTLAINGGVVWTGVITDEDVTVDASLYSAGDVIWDTQELPIGSAVINANISGSTLTDAVGIEANIAIHRTLGPGTALGICAATTMCSATVGAVLVNGAVYLGPPVEPPPPPPPIFG